MYFKDTGTYGEAMRISFKLAEVNGSHEVVGIYRIVLTSHADEYEDAGWSKKYDREFFGKHLMENIIGIKFNQLLTIAEHLVETLRK